MDKEELIIYKSKYCSLVKMSQNDHINNSYNLYFSIFECFSLQYLEHTIFENLSYYRKSTAEVYLHTFISVYILALWQYPWPSVCTR